MATFIITRRAFARERISFTNGGVTSLTASVYNDASTVDPRLKRRACACRLVLDSATGDMHFTEEGTTPTVNIDNSGVGTIAGARDIISLDSYEAIQRFKGIALTATVCDVEVVYYR